MHLSLIIYGSLDTISGGYLYDRMLVQHLRRCGDEVDIISLSWRNYAAHLADNLSPSLLRRLRERCDVLLQDELNHPSLFLANRLARRRSRSPRQISIVHHLRSSEDRPAWQTLFSRFIEKLYLSSVDGFIFNSRATKKAAERLAASHRPSVVAPPAGNRFGPALDPDRIRERVTRPGSLKLVFVGNLIRRKGLHTLLDTLAQIADGWELNVVGSAAVDRGYVTEVQRRIAKVGPAPSRLPGRGGNRGEQPRINVLDVLTDSELAAQLAKSHVLVVPSSYEGFGIVYLEGMCFGLPAIATTAGAAGEIITHGQDGFFWSPPPGAALARHIQTLINDRKLLLDMSLAARERYLRHPTWEQSMGTAREFLQKIVCH